MNHDSPPTLPAVSLHHSHELNEVDGPQSSNTSQRQNGVSHTQSPSLSPQTETGLSRKLKFLMNLSVNLDTLVFAELCILYYMEYVSSLFCPDT